MIDFAARIPPHIVIAGSSRWYLSGSNRCQMTFGLREDIRQTISRQHDAAFGKGLDGRAIVCREDLCVLLILIASELPVAVGVLFRHAEALLSGPSFKTGSRQFGELRSCMGRL
jgi:hypothetical protein